MDDKDPEKKYKLGYKIRNQDDAIHEGEISISDAHNLQHLLSVKKIPTGDDIYPYLPIILNATASKGHSISHQTLRNPAIKRCLGEIAQALVRGGNIFTLVREHRNETYFARGLSINTSADVQHVILPLPADATPAHAAPTTMTGYEPQMWGGFNPAADPVLAVFYTQFLECLARFYQLRERNPVTDLDDLFDQARFSDIRGESDEVNRLYQDILEDFKQSFAEARLIKKAWVIVAKIEDPALKTRLTENLKQIAVLFYRMISDSPASRQFAGKLLLKLDSFVEKRAVMLRNLLRSYVHLMNNSTPEFNAAKEALLEEITPHPESRLIYVNATLATVSTAKALSLEDVCAVAKIDFLAENIAFAFGSDVSDHEDIKPMSQLPTYRAGPGLSGIAKHYRENTTPKILSLGLPTTSLGESPQVVLAHLALKVALYQWAEYLASNNRSIIFPVRARIPAKQSLFGKATPACFQKALTTGTFGAVLISSPGSVTEAVTNPPGTPVEPCLFGGIAPPIPALAHFYELFLELVNSYFCVRHLDNRRHPALNKWDSDYDTAFVTEIPSESDILQKTLYLIHTTLNNISYAFRRDGRSVIAGTILLDESVAVASPPEAAAIKAALEPHLEEILEKIVRQPVAAAAAEDTVALSRLGSRRLSRMENALQRIMQQIKSSDPELREPYEHLMKHFFYAFHHVVLRKAIPKELANDIALAEVSSAIISELSRTTSIPSR